LLTTITQTDALHCSITSSAMSPSWVWLRHVATMAAPSLVVVLGDKDPHEQSSRKPTSTVPSMNHTHFSPRPFQREFQWVAPMEALAKFAAGTAWPSL
jgi:hypothetical protein